MTKLQQFSNEFDALYSNVNNQRTGGVGRFPSPGPLLPRALGKRKLYGALEEAAIG